jgi:hypothetical protein
MDITDSIDELTERIIGCAIAVHTALGPGLLESIYYDCLVIELVAAGLRVERDRSVPVLYRGQRVRHDLRLDLVVEGHQAQLITYLKLTGLPAGLLLNFNATTLRAGLKRADHPDRYLAKHARS